MELLAGLGYRAIAITPDVGQLDPLRSGGLDAREVRRVRRRAKELDLAIAIETGARFVLDPARKHWPTLLEPAAEDRARRVDFLKRSIDLADALDAPIVSIWAGKAPDGATGDPRRRARASAALERLWDRLVDGLVPVLDHARGARVRVGFEPEPGMFVERPSGYLELVRRLGARGEELGLTLDVGHLLATRDLPVERWIERLAPHLVHVQLDDAPIGRHEHRMFGTGDLDLRACLRALSAIGFAGQASVELSRDSHRGAEAAAQAMGEIERATGTRRRPSSLFPGPASARRRRRGPR